MSTFIAWELENALFWENKGDKNRPYLYISEDPTYSSVELNVRM